MSSLQNSSLLEQPNTIATPPPRTAPKCDYLFRIALVGNIQTGKSAIMMRFADNVKYEANIPTIGVDFRIKRITVPYIREDDDFNILQDLGITLHIWDTAGQQRFQSIVKSYLKSTACFVVYDIGSMESFSAISSHVLLIRENSSSDDPIIYLLGNKLDAFLGNPDYRKVTYEQGMQLATELNLLGFMEVSAHNDTNIEMAFNTVLVEQVNTARGQANRPIRSYVPPKISRWVRTCNFVQGFIKDYGSIVQTMLIMVAVLMSTLCLQSVIQVSLLGIPLSSHHTNAFTLLSLILMIIFVSIALPTFDTPSDKRIYAFIGFALISSILQNQFMQRSLLYEGIIEKTIVCSGCVVVVSIFGVLKDKYMYML